MEGQMHEWNVGQLLAVSSGYWRGCAIQAAVRLQFFTCLAHGAVTADNVAAKAKCDGRATAMLLDAMAALGLIFKDDGRYRNSDFATRHLVVDGPDYLGHIILHHHHVLDGWAQLDEAVRTGKKVARRHYGEEIERESFLMGMFNLASKLAPHVAKAFPLAKRRRLLDLGGGPGTYAIHFCLANPTLEAVIFDRVTTEPFARKTIASFELDKRIDFHGGDFTVDPIGGGPYDAAWLSHILHSNNASQCTILLESTARVMEPGGVILVHDFILNDAKDGPEFPALFALNMLQGTDGGAAYSREEIVAMMEQAGFGEIEHRQLNTPNNSSVLCGIRK